MKNITLLFALAILLLPLALASDYLPQKQNTQFNLTVQSNNATSCNLTYIQYPNGQTVLYNLAMTKSGRTFVISISANNYTQLGSQCHGVVCTDGSSFEPGTVCREITPSGFVGTVSFYIIFLLIITLIFALGFMTKNNYIMFLGSVLIIIFGFYGIVNGFVDIKDTNTTWAIGIICWAIGVYGLFLSVEEQLKEWN